MWFVEASSFVCVLVLVSLKVAQGLVGDGDGDTCDKVVWPGHDL